jgi:Domain of unknown function (DUF362)
MNSSISVDAQNGKSSILFILSPFGSNSLMDQYAGSFLRDSHHATMIFRSVSHKDGLLVKKSVIANGVLDSNGLVSLPKLNTHGLVRFTGAKKNQFRCVLGLPKGSYHVNHRILMISQQRLLI